MVAIHNSSASLQSETRRAGRYDYGNMQQKKVVGYCRVSTLEQQKHGYGIAIQRRDITRYAQERHWCIAEMYIDEARSGMDEQRQALQRLRRACKAGRVEVVIVASLDRLSRSLRFAENLFYEFERCGVEVCIVDMPHYHSRDRKEVLIRQIKAAIAEENRKDIIERLKKGREERARKGRVSGGNVAYGYARHHGSIQIVVHEAEIVRQIFTLSTQGLNEQAIATTLNTKGYQRRNGKPWTQRQVWAIVHRRALYKEGAVKYGKILGRNADLILLREG
jgi:DNA invertase Pin-like site-specific DNA recombinase